MIHTISFKHPTTLALPGPKACTQSLCLSCFPLGSLLYTQVCVTHSFLFQAGRCCKIVGCFLLGDNLVPWKESPFSHLKFLCVMKRNTLVCVHVLDTTPGTKKANFLPSLWNLQNLRTLWFSNVLYHQSPVPGYKYRFLGHAPALLSRVVWGGAL